MRPLTKPKPRARSGGPTKASLCLIREVGKPMPGRATRQDPSRSLMPRASSRHAPGNPAELIVPLDTGGRKEQVLRSGEAAEGNGKPSG